MIKTEIDEFMRDWRKLKDIRIPTAIVTGFARTALRGRDAVRTKTRTVFKLHSEYIPNSILSLPHPDRKNQINASVKGLIGKHADFKAAVFVRGADIFGQRKPSNPEKDLGFMTLHEEGGKKQSIGGGMVAVPAIGIQRYSFKSKKGKVKGSWKPETLLKEFNRKGAAIKGRKKRTKRSNKGNAFIMESKKGIPIVVRRKTRKRYPLELLYMFFPSTQINKVWGFVDTVTREVRKFLLPNVEKEFKRRLL